MRHFQGLVSDCALSDLAYVGALFTWWNKREEEPIGKKLDHFLIVIGCVFSHTPKLNLKLEVYQIMLDA